MDRAVPNDAVAVVLARTGDLVFGEDRYAASGEAVERALPSAPGEVFGRGHAVSGGREGAENRFEHDRPADELGGPRHVFERRGLDVGGDGQPGRAQPIFHDALVGQRQGLVEGRSRDAEEGADESGCGNALLGGGDDAFRALVPGERVSGLSDLREVLEAVDQLGAAPFVEPGVLRSGDHLEPHVGARAERRYDVGFVGVHQQHGSAHRWLQSAFTCGPGSGR